MDPEHREPGPIDPFGDTSLSVGPTAPAPSGAAPAPGEAPPDPLLGRRLGSHFTVVRGLERGGMGSVYVARDEKFGREVAVKFLPLGELAANPVALQRRFEAEGDILGRLRNPFIVTAIDRGRTEDGLLYIVTELLPGVSLAKELSRLGRISPERTLRILIDTSRALSAAHGAGVVHRDLKPGNLFLVREGDDDETTKVLDFGIAKVAAGGDLETMGTQAGAIMGTLPYMSPEQAAGEEVDARSDLYSLGVVAFHCLTGRLPFQDSGFGVLMAHRTRPPPSFAEVAPELTVDPRVERLVMSLLAKRPDERPPTAKRVREALEALLPRGDADAAAEPVPAPAPVPAGGAAAAAPDVGPKAAPRRGRAPLAVAGAALVVLGGLTAVRFLATPVPAPRALPTGLVALPAADADADALYRRFEAGDLGGFAEELRRRGATRPETAYAVGRGVASLRLGRCEDAREAAAEVERLCPACPERGSWEPTRAAIETTCMGTARIEVQAPEATLTVDERPETPGRPLRLPVGRHRVSARAPGHETRTATLTVVAGREVALALELPAAPRPEVAADPRATAARAVEPRATAPRARWGVAAEERRLAASAGNAAAEERLRRAALACATKLGRAFSVVATVAAGSTRLQARSPQGAADGPATACIEAGAPALQLEAAGTFGKYGFSIEPRP